MNRLLEHLEGPSTPSPEVRSIVERILSKRRTAPTHEDKVALNTHYGSLNASQATEKPATWDDYVSEREARIRHRMRDEQEAKEGKKRLSILTDTLVIALGGESSRGPFDCLYEPWTMASWPTPPE